MRGTQCLFNSRHALYRVFISPAERSEAQFLARQLLPLLQRPAASLPQSTSLLSIRGFATPRRKPQKPAQGGETGANEDGVDTRWTTQERIKKSGRDRPPQDHEITDPRIMVLEHGTTEGPLQTRYVLSKLEPDESLRMIQPYIPAGENRPPQYALCKIVNKREEYERQRQVKERKRADKANKAKLKEVEITWTIGENDLATKIRQMGAFLDKGYKVELAIGKKKRGRDASTEEIKEVLAKVREGFEAQGAKETKPATGNPGATMKLYLEGKKKE
jgi:translation initiation factor IF-3